LFVLVAAVYDDAESASEAARHWGDMVIALGQRELSEAQLAALDETTRTAVAQRLHSGAVATKLSFIQGNSGAQCVTLTMQGKNADNTPIHREFAFPVSSDDGEGETPSLPESMVPHAREFAVWWLAQWERECGRPVLRLGDLFEVRADVLFAKRGTSSVFDNAAFLPVAQSPLPVTPFQVALPHPGGPAPVIKTVRMAEPNTAQKSERTGASDSSVAAEPTPSYSATNPNASAPLYPSPPPAQHKVREYDLTLKKAKVALIAQFEAERHLADGDPYAPAPVYPSVVLVDSCKLEEVTPSLKCDILSAFFRLKSEEKVFAEFKGRVTWNNVRLWIAQWEKGEIDDEGNEVQQEQRDNMSDGPSTVQTIDWYQRSLVEAQKLGNPYATKYWRLLTTEAAGEVEFQDLPSGLQADAVYMLHQPLHKDTVLNAKGDPAVTIQRLVEAAKHTGVDFNNVRAIVTAMNPEIGQRGTVKSLLPIYDGICTASMNAVLNIRPKCIIGFGREVRLRW
jgi:hypothetical protein